MTEKLEPSDGLRETHNVIDFGFEIEAFLQSKIGIFLINSAEAEIAEAVENLKVIDPTNTEGIKKLQNQIWRAESVQYWLASAIQAGANAQTEFINQGD